jgi:NADP-dependent 3-hydroxy acid dehydrogenase YdfG
VLIAGASGTAAKAVAGALSATGANVLGVARSQAHVDDLAAAVPGVDTRVCDLTDPSAVAELAMRIHVKFGDIAGIVHLVGGWRGGGGIAGQTDDDWRFLERSFTALRNLSRAFYDDLVASPAGRLAIVSSTALEHPLAGGANYAAAKAAAEAWTRAVGQGFGKAGDSAAAAIFRVTALDGLEQQLADAVVDLWAEDAASLNCSIRTLRPVE